MNIDMQKRIEFAREIEQKIASSSNLEQFLAKVNNEDNRLFFHLFPHTKDFSPKEIYLLYFLLAIGVTSQFFSENQKEYKRCLKKLAIALQEVDEFYKPIGGLIGYYCRVVELICGVDGAVLTLSVPPVNDFKTHTEQYFQAFSAGLAHIDECAEVYVVGGAGDRLDLHDEKTNVALPAARLPFLGRTLLEGLIRDLEAKEYLAYKLFGKRHFTPILLMTSSEKHNDEEILHILQENRFFGRPKDSFFRIIQPLVPLITEDGLFASNEAGAILFKPGGHGVIWKLLEDGKGFSWLKEKGCRYLSIRQINNPLGFVDCAPIVLSGLGVLGKKAFGFAGCPRDPRFAEGVNVLQVRDGKYSISNYEYTKPNKDLSTCPANSNILFASIEAIQKALRLESFPGSMVNMRSHQLDGKAIVRLESTMQNISDVICDDSPNNLSTFLTLFSRNRLISTTKRLQGDFETPVRAYFDLQYYWKEALKLPQQTFEEYQKSGPDYVLQLHPAVGPLTEIIEKKLDVALKEQSELEIEVAEVLLSKVNIDGSLRILGSKNGSCVLKNVTISNRGFDKNSTLEQHWKRQLQRFEACTLHLHGNGVFIAENVTFNGAFDIDVPSGYIKRAYMDNGVVAFTQQPLPQDFVCWKYHLRDNGIVLECAWQNASMR